MITRVAMDRWARQMGSLMEEELLIIYLIKKYVDNTQVAVENIGEGVRWCTDNKRARWTQEREDQDTTSRTKSNDRRTMDYLLGMANSIYPYIQFTGELCEDNDTGTCLMLDFQAWKVRTKDSTRTTGYKEVMLHKFDHKPCSSRLVLMKKSAMPDRCKIVTLSQEVVQRMRTTSRSIQVEDRVKILEDLMIKMMISGYTEGERRTPKWPARILLTCQGRDSWKQTSQHTSEHGRRRERHEEVDWKDNLAEQKTRKLQGGRQSPRGTVNPRLTGTSKPRAKQTHFNEQRTEAVIFVTCTPNGTLRKKLQEVDDRFAALHGSPKMRFVEKSGSQLKDSLANSNPWGGRA